jgi:cytochrome c oxidase cbb3-type subunit 4
MENIREIQGYVYFGMTVVFVISLYAYIVYLYRGKERGTDYEKYSDLALRDDINDEVLEARKDEEKDDSSK